MHMNNSNDIYLVLVLTLYALYLFKFNEVGIKTSSIQ